MRQLPIEMIEGPTKVVENVPSDDQDSRRSGVGEGDLRAAVTRLRIALKDNAIRVGIKKPNDLGIKIEEVLFCPFEFHII